jgi:hypothetical protein
MISNFFSFHLFFSFKISNNYLNKLYSRWVMSLQKRKISISKEISKNENDEES